MTEFYELTTRGTRYKRTKNGKKAEAVARGDNKYMSDTPCKRGHLGMRYTLNHQCVECGKTQKREHQRSDAGRAAARRRHQRRYDEEPWLEVYDRVKSRAKAKGIPFNLTKDYLESIYPEDRMCPVLGIPLIPNVGGINQTRNSPSLDKIRPELGYVMGNVAIMSAKANAMKMDASTPEELRMVADWLEKTLANQDLTEFE